MFDTRNVSKKEEWGSGSSFCEASFNELYFHFMTEAVTVKDLSVQMQDSDDGT